MFDQLTDYNDDDEQPAAILQHRIRYMHEGGQGEDEDESGGDMYMYRNKIQAINDELANFIGLAADDCEDDFEQDSPGGVDRKQLNLKIKRIMKFLRTLDSELTCKQQLLDQREHTIAKMTREKGIL